MTSKFFIYVYLDAALSIRNEASLPQVVSLLKMRGIEIIDVNEEARRVVVKANRNQIHYLLFLAEKYANYVSITIKAMVKARNIGSFIANKLKYEGVTVVSKLKQHKREIYLVRCKKGLIYIETMKNKALLKACRDINRTLIREVIEIPPSACIFIFPNDNVGEELEEFNICLRSIFEYNSEAIK